MTPLFKKLNLKNERTVHSLHAPDSFQQELVAIRQQVSIATSLTGRQSVEFCIAFATTQKEVDTCATQVASRLVEDGVLWIAYPKATSKKYTCDFNRDTGWDTLGKLGFEPVRQVAIDDDWSALRFRRVEHIKKMTRGFAMTEIGKEKVAKAKKVTQKKSK